MSRRRYKRKIAAMSVLSALLFNLAAGLYLPSTAQGALLQAGITDTQALDSIVICTPNGLKAVRLGADGKPLPNQPHQDAYCVHCLPCNMGQSAMAGASAIEVLPSLSALRITYPAGRHSPSSEGSYGRHSIRAPPSFQ